MANIRSVLLGVWHLALFFHLILSDLSDFPKDVYYLHIIFIVFLYELDL